MNWFLLSDIFYYFVFTLLSTYLTYYYVFISNISVMLLLFYNIGKINYILSIFDIWKIILSLIGYILMLYSDNSIIIETILGLNIFITFFFDKSSINILLGLFLVLHIDYHNLIWICLYSIWNAIFTYNYNFSNRTRLVLFAPIILSFILQDRTLWIKFRCISLVLSQFFRYIEFTKFYENKNTWFNQKKRRLIF